MTKHKEFSPKFDRKTAAQLREEIEELKLELLFRETEEEIYAQNALEAEQNARINEWMQRHVLQQIDAAGKPATKRKILKKPILSFRMPTRIASICTASLIFFLVGSGAGFAAATFLQRQAGAFVITPEDGALDFRFQVAQEPISVPAEWQGEYFPSYIPDGFGMLSVSGRHSGSNHVYYENSEGISISFSEYGINAGIGINSENTVVTFETVGRRMVTVSEMENCTVAIFVEGDKLLSVSVTDPEFTAYATKAEALKIVQNTLLLQ